MSKVLPLRTTFLGIKRLSILNHILVQLTTTLPIKNQNAFFNWQWPRNGRCLSRKTTIPFDMNCSMIFGLRYGNQD